MATRRKFKSGEGKANDGSASNGATVRTGSQQGYFARTYASKTPPKALFSSAQAHDEWQRQNEK